MMTVEKIVELKEIKAEIKRLEEMAKKLENEMKEEMGQNELLEVGGFKLHYPIVVSERLDTKKIKKEMPSLYEQFKVESMTRRFSIT